MRIRFAKRLRFGRDDTRPTCAVKLYVGAGVPGARHGSYRKHGFPTEISPTALERALTRRVGQAFTAATMIRARGSWEGTWEDSLIIEVLDDPNRRGSCQRLMTRATRLAESIRKMLGQSAVMVVVTGPRGETRRQLVEAK